MEGVDSHSLRDGLDTAAVSKRAGRTRINKLKSWIQSSNLWDSLTPTQCRYDPCREFVFSMPLNLLFGLASTITVANLYYSYSILNEVAAAFNVSYVMASLIPTLLQAGYGSGILLLCPLGDFVRPRPFVITLVLTTATVWIGICLAQDFHIFCALSFIAGFMGVAPQLLLPLAGSLAMPDRKATSISIVFSGLMLGLVLPRLFSGILAEYTHWRVIYWVALGLQYGLAGLLWRFFPDYPAANSAESITKYPSMLWSILCIVCEEPTLAFGCILTFLANAALASFWTTHAALLASSPYNLTPLAIGLFSLVSLGPILLIPLYARFVVDGFATQVAAAGALIIGIGCTAVGAWTGKLSLVGVVVQALGTDFGVDASSVAYRTAIYGTRPKARNRTNVAYTACSFMGQLMGTSVGNLIYKSVGWNFAGVFNMCLMTGALAVVAFRGPREQRWFGWKGGIRSMKPPV